MTSPEKYGVDISAKSTTAKYAGLFEAIMSMGIAERRTVDNIPLELTAKVPLYPHYVPKSTITLILGSIRQKIRNHRIQLAKLGNCTLSSVTSYQVRAELIGSHWNFYIIVSPSPNDCYKIQMAAAEHAYFLKEHKDKEDKDAS